MHTAQRAIRRLAFTGWLGLVALAGLPAQVALAAAPPEKIVPDSTILFFKLNDAKAFGAAFRNSQYGQIWNDPSLKDFREELGHRMDEGSKTLKDRIGLTMKELFQIPRGALTIAVLGREDANLPAAMVVMADAGENQQKLEEALERGAKQAEEAGAKSSTESFNGLTLHIVVPPPKKEEPKEDKEKDKDKPKDRDVPRPPLVWTNAKSLFFIGSDPDVVKDLAAHRDGRENSLSGNENFVKTLAKTDAANGQAVWYVDLAKVIKLMIGASGPANDPQAAQAQVLAKELGVFGLKSVGGSISLGAGNYDSQTKTFFNAPRPVEGLLKVFSWPAIALRPESWVPATVATYQTVSFDLDNAYVALEELVNKFQAGMINIVEQQLVGPEGGQPLSIKNDVFGPLGDRVTLITDYKKPLKEDSQRMLGAIALENAKAFQNTLTRLLQISGARAEDA